MRGVHPNRRTRVMLVTKSSESGPQITAEEAARLQQARDRMIAEGARVLGDGQPKIGAHGKPVLFFHPKDFSGALVEIEQA